MHASESSKLTVVVVVCSKAMRNTTCNKPHNIMLVHKGVDQGDRENNCVDREPFLQVPQCRAYQGFGEGLWLLAVLQRYLCF